MDRVVRDELLAMAATDQDVRERVERHSDGNVVPDEMAAEWSAVDAANTARLVEIVATIGWPGRSLVGDDGAQAAWLLAQHADAQPDVQAGFLRLVQAAAEHGEVPWWQVAYLTDRVAVHAGRAQVYGTQFELGPDGSYIPQPIDDPDGVDARRAQMGLPSLTENTAEINQRYRH